MKAPSQPVTIVVADDDEDDRMLLQDALQESDVESQIHFVKNGQELLDFLRESLQRDAASGVERPLLVLLDLNMPRKDGRQALREIKSDQRLRSTPVVVLTTSKADEDVASCYDSGANSYIIKPMSFEGLVEVVNTLGRYWGGTVRLP